MSHFFINIIFGCNLEIKQANVRTHLMDINNYLQTDPSSSLCHVKYFQFPSYNLNFKMT